MMDAVITTDQLLTFDYSTLFAADHIYSKFSHPAVPILAVLAYLLLSNVVFNTIRTTFGLTPKGPVIQTITVLHSLALAVYSGWTCYNSTSLIYGFVQQNGFWATLYDPDQAVWNGVGWWVVHFYISKYYEFIDTWIVLLKGRTPIFLQVYHHAGVVILMWLFVVTKCTGGSVIILVLNSGIHTIMYTYYVMSAFGYQSPLKHYLTQAQLLQFIVGISVSVPMHWGFGAAPGVAVTGAQHLALAGIQLYAVGLIFLFGQFYVASYSSKKGDKGDKKKK
jgi:hypothetical protein